MATQSIDLKSILIRGLFGDYASIGMLPLSSTFDDIKENLLKQRTELHVDVLQIVY